MTLTSKLGTSNSTLGNIQLGGGQQVLHFVNAENTLIFSQVAISAGGGVASRSVISNLSLLQSVKAFRPNQRPNNIITFSQLLQAQKTLHRTFTHSVNFIQAANYVQIRTAKNVLTFSQSTTVTKTKGVNTPIAFVQTLTSKYNPHFELSNQLLLINQSALEGLVYTRTLTSNLVFNQSVNITKIRSFLVNQLIVFQNFAVPIKIFKPIQAFTINQTVTKQLLHTRSVTQVLQLAESINRNVAYIRSLNNVFNFKNHYFKYTEISGNTELIYIPDVVVTKPQSLVLLKVPDYVLVLEEPKFDDTEGGLSKLIQQRTVNGDMYTYVRKSTSRKLHYVFDVSRNKALETRQYILDHLSDPMYLENWKGEVWYGYIVNNPYNVQAKRRSMPLDIETSEIEVEFEGVRIH